MAMDLSWERCPHFEIEHQPGNAMIDPDAAH